MRHPRTSDILPWQLVVLSLLLGEITHTPGVAATDNDRMLIPDVMRAQLFLDSYNALAEIAYYKNAEASWAFYTNITDHNRDIMLRQNLETAAFQQEAAANASMYNTTGMQELMKREFIKIMDIGTSAQTDPDKLSRLNEVESELQTLYSTAKVCLQEGQPCVSLEPDLVRTLATSKDYDTLLKVWSGWRDASGKRMKDLYSEFVELSNAAVRILNHDDTGAYWRSWYDTPTFDSEVRTLFEQLRPLYEHLHGYVRRHLKQMYGADKFPSSGQIPAHLLGNMWAQDWSSLAADVLPFKNKPFMNVTNEMIKQGYTPVKIFRMADDFFASLGLEPMPEEFWNKSMLEKPTDGREVVCHASAWDFYNRKDFRVKQCTEVTQAHMETAHHEMGHIEYYLQYKEQPVEFRRGANPGFHEAVGDVISLSVKTPEHMHSIGLLPSVSDDAESDINFLMTMALEKIAFLPFGYLIDQWRWGVFSGDTTPDTYNDEWWNLRCRHQGVSPPITRTSSDFDPGAKFHIPANTPYIRYFVSFVIQFQFHKAVCDAAGHTGPLHRCDIYNNTQAGTLLGDMLKLGSSQEWPYAMNMITGQTNMDAQPLMDYFSPLLEFLREENGNDYGWNPICATEVQVGAFNSAPLIGVSYFLLLIVAISYTMLAFNSSQ